MVLYGRLDIHEPAGTVKSYRLANDETTVGRSLDNSIVLDDPAVSDRHCRFQLLDGAVHIVNLDATTGILLDGAAIMDSLPRPLRDVVELALGKTKIVFYPTGDQPTLPMRSISEHTQPIRVPLRVNLEKSVLDVYPASSSSLEIAIDNRSGKEISLAIDVDGLPNGWAKLSQSSARLVKDESAFIILSVAPPRRADVKPGDYPATIVIRPQSSAEAELRISLLVRLHGFGGLSLAVAPALVAERDSLQLFMLNQGNEDLRLALRSWEPAGQLEFDLPETGGMEGGIQLEAGQRGVVSCRVAAHSRPFVGKPREIPFALLVQADNDCAYQAAMPARVLVKPRLSARQVGTAVILIAAFALALFAMLTRIPPPEINTFAISEAQVARGTAVELTWQASSAQRFVIEIDRVAIAELDADASSFALTTDDYADPIEVALIAVAGDATDIEKRRLDIYQPASIRNFAADRQQLIRKVEQELVLTWRADGAVSSDLRFPAQFHIEAKEELGASNHRLILRGIPVEDFDLILAIQDEIGTTIEERLSINTADPECAPLRDTPLYAGPDRRFEQKHVALSEVPVLVLGRLEAGDWMLVELANGENGWGPRSDYFCAGFDPSALLVITDLPPLPTATPTATAEPTLPPTATDEPTPSSTTGAETTATGSDDET